MIHVSSAVTFSKSLGMNETLTPSSSHLRIILSSTSFGAVEKVMITCWTPWSATTRSRSQLDPRTGKQNAVLVGLHRLLVDEADRLQAELRMLQEPLGGQSADPPGTDDQGGPESLAVEPCLRPRPVERNSAGGDVDGRERPGPEGLRREVGGLREELAKCQHRHGGKRRRGDGAAQVFQDVRPKPWAVHAAGSGGGDDEDTKSGEPQGRRRLDTGGSRPERGRKHCC